MVKFDGFLKVYMEGKDDEDGEEQEGLLPDMKQGEHLGLERGQFGDRRLDLHRHQLAVALHLQRLADGNVEIGYPVMLFEHGGDPVVNLRLFHGRHQEKIDKGIYVGSIANHRAKTRKKSSNYSVDFFQCFKKSS